MLQFRLLQLQLRLQKLPHLIGLVGPPSCVTNYEACNVLGYSSML